MSFRGRSHHGELEECVLNYIAKLSVKGVYSSAISDGCFSFIPLDCEVD